MEASSTLVIDPGAANFRCGLSTALQPRLYSWDLVLGESTPSRKGVTDLDEFKRNVNRALGDERIAGGSETIILTTLPSLGSKQSRERYAEILFESIGAKGVAFCLGNVHALQSSGRHNGLLIDLGESGTEISVITNGQLSPLSTFSPRAGRSISSVLYPLIHQLEKKDLSYQSVVKLKERAAFVSQNLKEDIASPQCLLKGRYDLLMQRFAHSQQSSNSYTSLLPRELWPEICRYASCYASSFQGHSIGSVLCQCVEGALFDKQYAPTLFGGMEEQDRWPVLPELLHRTLALLPVESAEEVSKNIVLTGGTSLLPGLVERLHLELSLKQLRFPVHVSRSRDTALTLNWLGAAQFARREDFQKTFVTSRAEYHEEGSLSLYRKLA